MLLGTPVGLLLGAPASRLGALFGVRVVTAWMPELQACCSLSNAAGPEEEDGQARVMSVSVDLAGESSSR